MSVNGMLNFLWAGMILLGVAYGAAAGRIEDVSNGFIEGGGEAVSLCITMLGIVSLWTGVMEIARKSGLIAGFKKKISTLIKWLFPDVPPDHPASEYIAINLIANFCGLGWAATPAGLKAMEALAALQDERAGHHVTKASDAMCAFLIINISSIQLIPVNIIAYRAEYGSVNPAAIIIPGIIATTISTLAGVIFCKIRYRQRY